MSRDADVAVVSTSFPARAGDPSGHFVATHVRQLAEAHRQVTVLVPEGASTGFPANVTILSLGGARLFGWPGALANARAAPWRLAAAPSFALGARAALVARRPALVVAHWALPSALPVCWGLDVPLEVWWHGADARLLARLPAPLARAAIAHLAVRARRMVFVASALRDAVRDLAPAASRARFDATSVVMPAPIEVAPRAELPPVTTGLPEGTPYVVWCGRDVPDKHLDLAVRATRRAGLSLVVVGPDGAMRDADAHVVRLGALPRPSALGIIAGAAALLSTSSAEGAPTVVREARAYGVPVIATPAGDLSIWAASDPGITLVRADEEAIARALRERS